ncbi:beta-glucosidase BglX [Amphibacillus cookii]|uniref:beta-glucosidase BglX n=1 Tax=Amphibacillus cookii TaxID=767787 RepID=UPI00195F07AD|nr:beta-glucosidase BglX [Amphibacillus cookii]MBM7541163.1 beta-glucosidase [Amphibacillus cookii]
MNNEMLRKKVDQLTIQEKIGQLIQLTGNFFDKHNDSVVTGPQKKIGLNGSYQIHNTGSILNTVDKQQIIEIQRNHLLKSTHKIPLLFMADIIYGFKTIFPIPLAQTCSWNFPLIEESATVLAKECYEEGIHVTFAPMVDLVRDPRWGRVMEAPGEDTLLGERYAESMVNGIQGNGASQHIPKGKLAACIKHFAAYGAAVAGREYNAVDMSENMLKNFFLPSYAKGIEAGAKLVMTAFNTLNGIPCTGNKWLNRDILRDALDFDGVLISDYAAIDELITHGYAENQTSAAKQALLAGVDIDMKTAVYANELEKLVEQNQELHALLDEAVLRVLILKNDLGLFDDPYRGIQTTEEDMTSVVLSKEHKATALKLAEESIVLLKNNKHTLPLSRNQKVALIGPYAEEKATLGFWAITGDEEDTITLKDGLSTLLDSSCLSVARGAYLLDKHTENLYDKYTDKLPVEREDEEALLEEAIAIAKTSDTIVLAVGENTYQSGEGGSRTNPVLPTTQLRLINALSTLGKPIVLVIYGGRPLILTEVEEKVSAILYAWFPGTMNGLAVANLLTGKANPSAKLSMTFPRSVGQIPIYYNELRTGRPQLDEENKYRFASRYIDQSNLPLYPFGFGKSYTHFQYSDFRLNQEEMTKNEQIKVTLTVKNTGSYSGKEIVQLYICDKVSSITRPVKLLKAFKKIELKVGESQRVEFEIDNDMLKFYRPDGSFDSESGDFDIFIGKDSAEHLFKRKIRLVSKHTT